MLNFVSWNYVVVGAGIFNLDNPTRAIFFGPNIDGVSTTNTVVPDV
jgi:hypothetical protein